MAANGSKPRPERRMRRDPRPFAMGKDQAIAMHRGQADSLRSEVRHLYDRLSKVRSALRVGRTEVGWSLNPFRLRRALKMAQAAIDDGYARPGPGEPGHSCPSCDPKFGRA